MKVAFLLLLILSSCCQKLTVRSEYLTESSLASYHVGTPDPRLACPFFGQQLILSWHIPSALWHGQAIELDLTVRFSTNEESHQMIRCDSRPLGTYLFVVDKEEFLKTGPIITYKVFLKEDGEVTESWIHPLWQERINL